MDPLLDWDQPISQDQLDEIEAAFDSVSSSIKRRRNSTVDHVANTQSCRRLPNWGSQSSSSSNSDLISNSEGENSSNTVMRPSYFRNQALSLLRPHQVNTKVKYPAIKFGGHIEYCRTVSEVEKAMMELLEIIEAKQKSMDQISLGFDIEWRPNFKRGHVPSKAAVMQICGDTSHCYVMHIIHSGIPPTLRSLLEDPKYVKVGVGIASDASKVLKDYNVRVITLEDLSCLAKQKLDGHHKSWGLASLTESLTCKQLEKPNKIRLGNWEVDVLSREQLQYAATDAYASWHLYQILKSFPDLSNNQTGEKVDSSQL